MDYGREKGFQDGESCRKTEGSSVGRFCLLTALLTASLCISLLALVLATSANLQVQDREEKNPDWIEEAKQEAVHEVGSVTEGHSVEERSSIAGRGASLDGVSEGHSVEERSSIAGRGASLDGVTEGHSVEERSSIAGRGASLDALCNSDVSPNTTERPSAHIVPAGGNYCLIKRPTERTRRTSVFEVNIAEGWNCGSPRPNMRLGHVRGGMKFNRTKGYLTLPVDGIYYIYSNVQFSSNTVASNIVMEYDTLVYTPNHPKLLTGSRWVSYLESYGRPHAAGSKVKATFNHGGLFHLPAGAQVSIAARYDTNAIKKNESLWFSGYSRVSYMGAFLVEEVPFDES